MPPYPRNDYTWDDEEEEEELEDYRNLGRDAILVCIDASSSMHEFREDQDDPDKQVSYFLLALKAAMMLERKKALQTPGDLVGIMIYNTSRPPDGESGTQEGMHSIHSIDSLTVERIMELKEKVEAAESDPSILMSEYPPLEAGSRPISYPDLFAKACLDFRVASVKTGTRRIFLVTDDDDPAKDLDTKAAFMGKKAMRTKLKDLSDLGVSIVPFFIDSDLDSKRFDNNLYWNEMLNLDPEPSPFPDSSLSSDADLDNVPSASGLVKFDELLDSMLLRQRPKRALWTVGLELAEGLTIGVKGYGLVTEQQRPAPKFYAALPHDMVEAVPETDWVDAHNPSAKAPYSPSNIRLAFDFGSTGTSSMSGAGPSARFKRMADYSDEEEDGDGEKTQVTDAEMEGKGKGKAKAPKRKRKKITFTKEEIAKLRNCGLEPGMKLLGFQDASTLKFEHNVKHSHFIYPDDSQYAGSTRTFAALLRSTLNAGKIGIARCIFRRGTGMVICAMLPQEETFTSSGGQDKAPGFHLIQFPFVDDMREPPVKIQEAEGRPVLKSAAEHTAIMQKIISKILPKDAYVPARYPNPVLARHNAFLESLAFDEDWTEEHAANIEDKTIPLHATINERAGSYMAQWKASIQSDEMAHSYVATATKKRSAASASSSSKGEAGTSTAAEKRAKAASEMDAQKIKEMWEDGTLGKNKVDVLKAFLRTVSAMPEKTTKPFLLEAVDGYFKRTAGERDDGAGGGGDEMDEDEA